MSNITITNNTLGTAILKDAEFRDGPLTFITSATILEGTILAVDSVTQHFVAFVKGGTTNENGIPKAVLTYTVTTPTGGDVQVRVGVAGSYRKERLVIAADGDDSNIDQAVIDQLRDYGIVPIDVHELNILDNQ